MGEKYLDRIPEDWKIKYLESISTEVGDGIHTTPRYVSSSNYFFINGNNLVNGNILITKDTKCVSEQEYNLLKKNLNSNTILISINGTIGNLAYYKNENVVLGKSVAYINLKKDFEKRLIFYLFQHPYIKTYFKNELTGTTINNLSLKSLRKTPIIIPTIMEQKKIASILSTVHDLIENTDHLINSYTLLKKGLMQTLLTKGIGHSEFKKTEIGEIPVEWQIKNLCEVITAIESGGRPTGGATENSGTITSFGGENILKDGGVDYKNVRKISLDYYKNMSMGKLNDKDILINKDGANTGKLGIYSNKYYKEGGINEHIFLIRGLKKVITQEFLYYFLLSDKGQYYIKQKITGSAQPGINKSFTHNFPVPVPYINEQEEISKILISLDEQLSIFKEKKEKLNLLKKGLMQQLLTGKIRVKV